MAARTNLKPGDNVKQLLIANGIFPDTEAFGLVYDLNPTVPGIATIAPGIQLILPRVSSASRSLLPQGDLVAVAMDSRMKEQLVAAIAELNGPITTARTFAAGRYDSADDRQSTNNALRGINDSFVAIANVIRGKVRPINGEVLNQTAAEAETLRTTLARLTDPSQKLSAEDVNTIKLIDADLRVKRRTLTDVRGPSEPPTRWREALVVVRTLGSDGHPVPLLRIYYVPEALRGRAQLIKSFDTLTSPSERSLPEANYVIWAGRPGQTTETTALSEVKKLALRRSSDAAVKVDLAIIH
jgi:hypothetical protein